MAGICNCDGTCTPSSLTAPLIPPTPNNRTAVYRLLIRDIEEKAAAGAKKYGTHLQPFNGRDALIDAYQEVIDLAMYLRQRIEEENAA